MPPELRGSGGAGRRHCRRRTADRLYILSNAGGVSPPTNRAHRNDPTWFRPPALYGFVFADLTPLPFRAYPGWMRFFPVGDQLPARCKPAAEGTVSVSDPVRPGLLVSVRSAAEAEAALAGGADLIDVKEPNRGSLGRADDAVIEEVIRVVAGRRPVSAAMGDWDLSWEWDLLRGSVIEHSLFAGKGLAYQKWGFAGWERLGLRMWKDDRWKHFISIVQSGAALVAYADWRRAEALPLDAVWELARRDHSDNRALVTGHLEKDGSTLLDWMPHRQIALLTHLCNQSGVRIALAGSLGPKEIAALAHLKPDWFAVRGAACSGGKREGMIDVDKVRELKALIEASVEA